MSACIAVSNLNKKHRINERFVRDIAKRILKALKKDDAKLEIVFLSDAAIKRVNEKYKHSDKATDVLSFELGSCAHDIRHRFDVEALGNLCHEPDTP